MAAIMIHQLPIRKGLYAYLVLSSIMLILSIIPSSDFNFSNNDIRSFAGVNALIIPRVVRNTPKLTHRVALETTTITSMMMIDEDIPDPSTFREAEVLGLRLMQEGSFEDALVGTYNEQRIIIDVQVYVFSFSCCCFSFGNSSSASPLIIIITWQKLQYYYYY